MTPSKENKSNRCHHECRERKKKKRDGVELKINQVVCEGGKKKKKTEGGVMGKKSVEDGRDRGNDGQVLEKKIRGKLGKTTDRRHRRREASADVLQAAGKSQRIRQFAQMVTTLGQHSNKNPKDPPRSPSPKPLFLLSVSFFLSMKPARDKRLGCKSV